MAPGGISLIDRVNNPDCNFHVAEVSVPAINVLVKTECLIPFGNRRGDGLHRVPCPGQLTRDTVEGGAPVNLAVRLGFYQFPIPPPISVALRWTNIELNRSIASITETAQRERQFLSAQQVRCRAPGR